MTELGLRTIPGYIIHELLETDLVGATYLAERQSDGYPVTLQVVAEELIDGEAAASYQAALERVADIGHPVVPAVWDVGNSDGLLYSVTGAVEGHSVASTLASGRALNSDQVRSICSELADALDILHAADIVHGAVNPHTVWINDRELAPSAPWVTLRGFGSAVLLSHHVTVEREEPPPSDVLYVAPEQIRREELTGRIDQYALACMVVHCLTGAPPFDRATANALFGAHLFAAPRTLEPRWQDMEPHVGEAVLRAMAKDPADRFPTCGAFATAIGGDASRSWTWMLQEALGLASDDEGDDPDGGAPSSVTVERPVASESEPADAMRDPHPGARPSPPAPAAGETSGNAPPPRRLTAHALAQADWLPGGSDGAPPKPQEGTTEALPLFSDSAASRWSLDARQWRKLVAAVVALALIIVMAVIATRRPASVDTAQAPGQPRAAVAAGVEPVWQRAIGSQGATTLTETGASIVSGAGGVLSTFDRATGAQRWRTRLDGQVTQIAAIDGTIIARTKQAVYGFAEETGQQLWDTAGDSSPWETMAAGRNRVFGIATTNEGSRLVIHALDPATGATAWSLDDVATAPAPATAAVFDRSRLGGQMLYVLHGSRLHAIATRNQRENWQIALDEPQIESLTAIAKAILVIGEDGQICRYGMQDGDAVWTACAPLANAEATQSVINTRSGRVIVSGAHEVAAVDFTRGTRQWQVTEQSGFQEASAANEDAAFVAHADGTVEAIAHDRGERQWRSEPFGTITAMTADRDAVYVATADGRLTRLPSPGADTN